MENEFLKKLPPEQLVKVIPTPIEIRPQPGAFVVKSSTVLFYDSSLRNEAEFLADALGELLDARVAVKEDIPSTAISPDAIRLRIGEVTVDGRVRKNCDEAYALTITPDNGIEIVGSDSAGVFYGIQTLRGLMPVDSYRQRNREISIDARASRMHLAFATEGFTLMLRAIINRSGLSRNWSI